MVRPELRPTIRTRLTLAAVAATVVMLMVASVLLVVLQRRSLTDGIDESLRQTADNLGRIDLDRGLPVLGDPEDTFIQVLATNGDLVASTANAASPVVTLGPGDLTSRSIRTERVERPPGRFRILIQPFDADGGRRNVLVVGRNLDDVTEAAHVLIAALAVVSPALVLLLGGLSWWLIGRTLRPVDDIRREVHNIGGRDLHRRVPVPDTEDEIATLARTMNAMLARVEQASDRQQQFVDDASHELRTPLTRMIAELDVALACPGDEDLASTIRRVHDDATDLRRLLEDLLYLARSSHTEIDTATEVDLDDIILTLAAGAARHSRTTIDIAGVSAAPVRGDRRALARAIDNIVSNAVHHARSTVTISCRADSGNTVVIVDDDGEGIPVPDRERVFTRFARLDQARSRDHGGAGLGLAIAHEIVSGHGGRITVSDNSSGGARFTISLPIA